MKLLIISSEMNMRKFLRYITLSFLLTLIPYDILKAMDCPHCEDLRGACLVAHPRPDGTRGGASGKWVDNTTPKRGWRCTGAKDLGAGITEKCGMCEREQVRFVHQMTHGDMELNVGCVCAGYMEGYFEDKDQILQAVANANRRVRVLENRDARRVNFPDLLGWKISKFGNIYIKKDGNLISIRKVHGRYDTYINNQIIKRESRTERGAKLRAFDHLNPLPRIRR